MALSEVLCHIQAGSIENKSIPGPQQTPLRRTGFASHRSILFFLGLNVIFFNNMISAYTAGRIQMRFKLHLCHLKHFLAGTMWSNSKRQQNFNDSLNPVSERKLLMCTRVP